MKHVMQLRDLCRLGGRDQRRGFTLIELVMVLIILSILATLALQSVETQVDQSRFEATQRLVQEVNDAIYKRSTSSDGRSLVSGFFVDMGRLPRAIEEAAVEDGLPVAVLTLRELWDGTTGTVPPFDSVAATDANIRDHDANDSDNDTIVADQSVTIDTGWRGPYLQLPVGADALHDGWGRHLRSLTDTVFDPADDRTYPHLIAVAGNDETHVTMAGGSVYGVRSLGLDDKADLPASAYDRDLPQHAASVVPGVPPFNGSRLALSDDVLKGTVSGVVYVSTATHGMAIDESKVIVQVYFPNPDFDPTDTGSKRLAVEHAEGAPEIEARGTSVVDPEFRAFDFQFLDMSGDPVKFPVGPRIVRAYYDKDGDDSKDYGDSTNDPASSRVTTVYVFPNTPSIDLTIN